MSVDASRITYIPHAGKYLLSGAGAGLAVPVFVGAFPAYLVMVMVWVFGGFSAALKTGAFLAGLGLVVGLIFAVSFVRGGLTDVRRIDLQPPGQATRVVFEKVRGTDSVAVADLRSVHVVEKIKLGRSIGCEAWFTTPDRHFKCPTLQGDGPMVPAVTLGGWFTERLGQAGVEVTYETAVERADLLIEDWYTRYEVAALWGVSIEEVDGLAVLLDVPNQKLTTRIGIMHGVSRTLQIFNPDDVHIVAAQVPAVRATASQVPPQETRHRESG